MARYNRINERYTVLSIVLHYHSILNKTIVKTKNTNRMLYKLFFKITWVEREFLRR